MSTVAIVAIKDSHDIIGYSSNRNYVGQIRVTNGCIYQANISGDKIIVQYTEGGRRYVNTYKTDWTFVSKLSL